MDVSSSLSDLLVQATSSFLSLSGARTRALSHSFVHPLRSSQIYTHHSSIVYVRVRVINAVTTDLAARRVPHCRSITQERRSRTRTRGRAAGRSRTASWTKREWAWRATDVPRRQKVPLKVEKLLEKSLTATSWPKFSSQIFCNRVIQWVFSFCITWPKCSVQTLQSSVIRHWPNGWLTACRHRDCWVLEKMIDVFWTELL